MTSAVVMPRWLYWGRGVVCSHGGTDCTFGSGHSRASLTTNLWLGFHSFLRAPLRAATYTRPVWIYSSLSHRSDRRQSGHGNLLVVLSPTMVVTGSHPVSEERNSSLADPIPSECSAGHATMTWHAAGGHPGAALIVFARGFYRTEQGSCCHVCLDLPELAAMHHPAGGCLRFLFINDGRGEVVLCGIK